jgi:hypothetical protein
MMPKNRADLEAMLNAKAWKDPKFKKKLLSDPEAALKEMGIDHLPKNAKVRIIEESSDTVTFVLHPQPKNVPALSEEELKKVSGGAGSCDWNTVSLCGGKDTL